MNDQKHADPTALGLFGLAMVTLVASSQKLELTHGFAYVVPWAIFLGAFAQLIAGILDYKKCNVFGGTAFCAYGFFWLAVAFSWLTNIGTYGQLLQSNIDPHQLGMAFIGYLIFSLYMTVAAVETNKVLLVIFIFIDFLFIGLALNSFEIAPHATHRFSGIAELCISLLSFYGSAASILNIHFGRTFLPVGKPLGIFRKASV